MSIHDKNSLSYWSGICPDYKTVEQFEMFIDSREKDIATLNESIIDAYKKMRKLEGKDCADNRYKLVIKRLIEIWDGKK